MAERGKMTELLERVEKATGPDTVLDVFLAATFYEGFLEAAALDMAGDVPRFTSSIDAALALVEKMLPGDRGFVLHASSRAYNDRGRFWFTFKDTRNKVKVRRSKTPALAILSAMLRALSSREGK
jgi:hypothetical protein